jgi:hypothetical protein
VVEQGLTLRATGPPHQLAVHADGISSTSERLTACAPSPQAMEPSARRCVTQAVRLANSGYVLLEFQRVTAHNLTGYVEANKLAQQFKRTASGRVEWEQYRRSGSLEPQVRFCFE